MRNSSWTVHKYFNLLNIEDLQVLVNIRLLTRGTNSERRHAAMTIRYGDNYIFLQIQKTQILDLIDRCRKCEGDDPPIRISFPILFIPFLENNNISLIS
jgi:hypothetical protein